MLPEPPSITYRTGDDNSSYFHGLNKVMGGKYLIHSKHFIIVAIVTLERFLISPREEPLVRKEETDLLCANP